MTLGEMALDEMTISPVYDLILGGEKYLKQFKRF